MAVFILCFRFINITGARQSLKVGFVYTNDESTAYTYNFSLAKDAVEKKYGDKVEIFTCSNVMDDGMEEPVEELVDKGCDIIFFNGYSELVPELATKHPDTEFCQTSYMDMSGQKMPSNYHTFKGEAYQGRYVSGIAAGKKIKEMIAEGLITEDQAIVGFVAAFPTSEVISGYTAFLLGVRSEVANAVMRVCYTQTWDSFTHERDAAFRLIDDGCVIISQHTDTIGPALACEAALAERPVYFVGYNQSMTEVAPGASLVTSRICWERYVVTAVDALMAGKSIESVIRGHIHGNDVSAGFEQGWVEIVDLNAGTAAPGTKEAMDNAIVRFKRGENDFVFRGNYKGVNPDDPSDTIELMEGYIENKDTSHPLFNYVLTDIITVVD